MKQPPNYEKKPGGCADRDVRRDWVEKRRCVQWG